MFDAFVTTKSQGMGLGLAICRLFVERHGGQLSAYSDGKTGALFQVVLPVNSADPDALRGDLSRRRYVQSPTPAASMAANSDESCTGLGR